MNTLDNLDNLDKVFRFISRFALWIAMLAFLIYAILDRRLHRDIRATVVSAAQMGYDQGYAAGKKATSGNCGGNTVSCTCESGPPIVYGLK